MLLKSLREEVLEANLELVRRGLVLYTFGNASAISRTDGFVAIKPSGVPYEQLTPHHMVVTTLDGKVVEGDFRPSSICQLTFSSIGNFLPSAALPTRTRNSPPRGRRRGGPSRVSGLPMPTISMDRFQSLKTLHPRKWPETTRENTGAAICRLFKDSDPMAIPAALVAGHAPFCWGANAAEAAHNAVILEYVARMSYYTLAIHSESKSLPRELHDKHYLRKHGDNASYGQGPTR